MQTLNEMTPEQLLMEAVNSQRRYADAVEVLVAKLGGLPEDRQVAGHLAQTFAHGQECEDCKKNLPTPEQAINQLHQMFKVKYAILQAMNAVSTAGDEPTRH